MKIKKTNKNNKIEGFEGEFLHPSIDIKNDILVLGFRYRSKSGDDKDLILVVKDENIEITEGESLVFGEKEYHFEKKGRRLIRIQERWSLADLNQFREDYAKLIRPDNIIPKANELLEEIKKTIQRYIELEGDADYWLLAAWVLGTYFYPAFSAYSFLNPKAPKRSGKSQLLGLLRQLCFNAVKARPTVAAIGDTLDSLRGTYLIDQADSINKKGNEELMDVLTDSYKRGGGKRRIVQIDNGKRSVLELETYSPKVFASIRELPEDLRDRCFIIPLLRSKKNFMDPNEDDGLWEKLRSKMYKFLIAEYQTVANEYIVRKIAYKNSGDLTGRTLELWLPFETILRCTGMTEKLEEIKKRFLSQYGFAEYEPSDLERETVLAIIGKLGENEKITLSPKAISENISAENFPPQSTPTQMATRVGWVIKNFNLSSEKKRTGEGICYLFERNKVDSVYSAYFPTQPTQAPESQENTTPDEVYVPNVGDESVGVDLHEEEPTLQTYTENSPEFASENQDM